MQDEGSPPGPDPSSLEAVDDVPADFVPLLNLRITYSSDKVSDWVGIHRDGRTVALELADPLLGIVRKIGRINDVRQELESALASIGVGGVVAKFYDAVAEFANQFLPVSAISPETMGMGLAVYLLGKLYDAGLLMLGQIHQADIEELPRWMEMFDEAERNPDITVH